MTGDRGSPWRGTRSEGAGQTNALNALSKPSRSRVFTPINAALAYAALGWPVLPLHWPRDGRCSCGKDCGNNAAKHPLTAHGKDDATTDSSVIGEWWKRWPQANVGVATGNDLLVVDVDPRHGGDESLRDLGELPDTVTALTGGGGQHLLFSVSQDCQSRAGALGPGLDVKCAGGYIVGPPSRHVSGGVYTWEIGHAPGEIELAPLPPGIAARLAENGRSPATEVGQRIPEGQRHDTLVSLAGTMRWRGMAEQEIAEALLVVNRNRCTPALSEREVRDIAHSVARYEPALPSTDSLPTRTVQEWPQDAAPEAFYGLAGDIVRTLEPHTEADPLALLSNVLGLFGNVVGYQPYFVTEQDRHGLRLFTIQVGETAKGRKGVAHEIARRLFLQAAPEWATSNITTGLSSGEGLIWAVRDAIEKEEPIKEKGRVVGYQTVLQDEGIGDKRLMVVEPEFARTLRVMMRDGNILSAVIRQAWDTGNLRVLTKSTPAKATEAHISIVGHITKAELLRYLDDSEAFNGFANRFLWVCVRRSKVLPEGGSVNEEEIAALAHRVGEAIRFGQGVRQMVRDDDARAIWREVYPSLSEGKPGLFGAVIGRAEAQVVRLACIYALLDKSSVVRANHLLAALAFWERCEASARYIFGDRTGDPVADTILAGLRAGPLSQTQISHLFKRHLPAGRIAAALATLEQAGLVTSEERETGGRPERVWAAT